MNPEIMDHARACDWRVLHAISVHQGYRTWKCRISLARLEKIARCNRKTVSKSAHWWADRGILRIRRAGKLCEFEIIRDFASYPDNVHRPRPISKNSQKRDSRGKYAPSTDSNSSPYTDVDSSPCTDYRTRSLSSEVLNKIPPPPPTGGNGRPSEASVRPASQISPETVKEFIGAWGEARTRQYLLDHGYPLPEGIFAAPKRRTTIISRYLAANE